ncbi:hemerythrin family protein [Candidatus Woesearchaeota archaeon]|nr:hemerythrin family protein [Candidatus Woesearchaeota archaeon]
MANKKSTDISKIKLDQSTPSNSKTQMKGKTVRKTVMKDNSTKDKHIVWKSKFKIGIDKIDEQHKQWFKYAEAVHELSVKEKTDKELLRKIVNEFIGYSRVHFSTEENYFKTWNYPHAEEHIREHIKLISNVLQLSDQLDVEPEKILDSLAIFLKEWLETHIKIHDFKYRNYFKENG